MTWISGRTNLLATAFLLLSLYAYIQFKIKGEIKFFVLALGSFLLALLSKEAVLPFDRFPDVDTLLGPEMKSTGEVMGIDSHFGGAYAKAQLGAGMKLPTRGTVFISVKEALGLPPVCTPSALLVAATKSTA